MIETIVASISVKVGSTLIKALTENRDVNSTDAGDLVTALLEAIVSGQNKANHDLLRVEKKIDVLTTNPYHAAMTAGSRLLSDAAPAHRRADDRRDMLNQARQAFAEAIGHAHGRAVDTARAEVMYGLTWLALGSPMDLPAALERATRVLQLELITTFQLNAHMERDWERQRDGTSTKIRNAVWGPSLKLPTSTNTDRLWLAQTEHDGVWHLLLMAQGAPARFPRILRPHGSAYSEIRPGLPIRFDPGVRQQLLDAFITLGATTLTVENLGSAAIRVALSSVSLGAEGVIPSNVSPLDTAATTLPPGMQVHGDRIPGQDALCLSLGRNEQEDLAVLAHDRLDWTTRAEREKDLRSGIGT